MNRRQFVSGLIAGSAMAQQVATAGEGLSPSDASVQEVLVMFKCHFDAGFVDTQARVIQKYFEQYFPRAIEIAQGLRKQGETRYVWTTGSWLIYEYLEQASAENRRRMEKALADGDIAWHALPFSWQSELLDRSAIAGAIGFSKSLDRRFGRQTTGAKMTDVPGHSRGLIVPLAESGVTFLNIGVNAASTPPDVPSAFQWREPGGASITMMYHHEYGGVVTIPGSSLAIDVEMRDDNSGPHTLEEINLIYTKLKQRFPNAKIRAANLTEIANAIAPYKEHLPVITQEIGDTWIYGVPSDPVKLARYRELLRLRARWIAQGKFKIADSTDLKFLSRFALAAEHTWGTDTKTWLDFNHYTPDALAEVLSQPKYQTVTGSWVEKRNDIEDGLNSLPAELQEEAKTRLQALTPQRPNLTGLQPFDPKTQLSTDHFILELDPLTGAIARLQSRASKREWASRAHPLARFSYQMLSSQDYDRFLASYITVKTDWAPKDFGKPNISSFGARSAIWSTSIHQAFHKKDSQGDHLILSLRVNPTDKSPSAAYPSEIYLQLSMPVAAPEIHCELLWFHKRANRLPEALWLTFNPIAPVLQGWRLTKIESQVSPFDVVAGGNRHMHAITDKIAYADQGESFVIEAMDAPVVVFGDPTPIGYSRSLPDMSQGVHFSLFNNGWGTNYVQWFGEDMRFRFSIRA
jgi:hypothetical protein